jgi:hypothetical protein
MNPSGIKSKRSVRRRYKNTRRAIALGAVTVSSISIIGYITLSLGVNTLPSVPNPELLPFAAVIQSASESQADQVSLQARAAESHNGEILYTLSACGTHPYYAELILNGLQSGSDATYAKEGIDTGYTVPQEKTFGISYPLDLATEDLGFGEVQEIDVSFPHVSPCPATLQQQLIAGVAQPYELRVFGTLSSPWTQQTKMLWGLLQGPHANLTFPMVGDISSPDGGVPTPFTVNSSPEKWTQLFAPVDRRQVPLQREPQRELRRAVPEVVMTHRSGASGDAVKSAKARSLI